MRVSLLDLIAFGPFTTIKIPLSDSRNFHLIFGLNEAGKSSALRALSALLYGIDTRTSDNFVHANPKLRVGGTLTTKNGDSISFYRRKGKTNTILNADDQPITDSELSKFVPISNQDIFKNFYGLNHEQLRAGGEELCRLDGDLALSLFIGAGDAIGIRSGLERIQSELAEILPKRRAKGLRDLVKQYNSERQLLKKHILKQKDWDGLQRELDMIQGRLTSIDSKQSVLKKRQSSLERINRSIPHVVKLEILEDRVSTLGRVTTLPDDYPYERRVSAMYELTLAQRTLSNTEDEIDGDQGLQKKLEAINVDRNILASDSIILDLIKRLGSHLKGAIDARGLKSVIKLSSHKAETVLQELASSSSVEDASKERLSVQDEALINTLALKYRTVMDGPQELEKRLEKVKPKLNRVNDALSASPPKREITCLKGFVTDAEFLGNVDSRLTKFRHNLIAVKSKAESALNSLPLWDHDVERLASDSFPLDETVERFERQFQELSDELIPKRKLLQDFEGRKRRLYQEIQTNLKIGSVPSEEELLNKRDQRDSGWIIVKDVWLRHESDQKRIDAYAKGEPLHEAYEHAVHDADETADRLRRETDRVTKLAIIRSDYDSVESAIVERRSTIADLEQLTEKCQNAWTEAWSDTGISESQPPAEMRRWLSRRQEVLRCFEVFDECESELSLLKGQRNLHRSKILNELKNDGYAVSEDSDSLRDIVSSARAIIEKVENANNERLGLENTREELETQHSGISGEIQEAENRREKFKQKWTRALAKIGLHADASAEEAQAVLRKYEELYKGLDEIQSAKARIDSINDDAKAFQNDLSSTIQRIAKDLAHKPAEEAVAILQKRRTQAEKDEQTSTNLQQLIETKRNQVEKLQTQVDLHTVFLDGLCKTAECSKIDELEKQEQSFRNFKELQEQIKEITTSLVNDSGGTTLDDFRKEVRESNQDAITAELTKIESQFGELSDEKEILTDKRVELRASQKSMEVQEAAVEFEERCQSLLAQMRRYAHRHVILSLSQNVLNRELERFKTEEQTPVLGRASRAFSTLTCQSFTGLRIEYDENDAPCIVGARPNGNIVDVPSMSDGTRDQLYLALRLAYINKESIGRSVEPMPFIADDILISFDDERASAALQQLAELSEATQVIFFTHHHHLVEIAKRSLSVDLIDIHEMARVIPD